MIEDTVPLLFPFIKLRYERFGGLLFNPHFNTELKLNRQETYIASLCDGRKFFSEIVRSVQSRYALSAIESELLAERTVLKLRDAMALDLYEHVMSSIPKRPDVPSFFRKAPRLSAPKGVVWEITRACNLRCSHCLNGSGRAIKNELDTAEALRLVDRIAEAGIFSVAISGGEPFMRPDIMTILQRIADAGLSAEIITNGQLVTDKIVSDLDRLPIYRVHVSIDGIGKTHDEIRGRKGAFQTACRSIRRLIDAGIGVNMNVTINSKNIAELDRLIDLSIRLGCDSFLVNMFLPVGRGKEHQELGLSMAQLLDASRRLTERRRELKGIIRISGESSSSYIFERPAGRDSKDGPVGCSAGNDTLNIGADGTAYPCPFLLDFPLGNILETPLKDIWNQAPVLQKLRGLRKKDLGEPCGSCRYSPKPCGCGCRAAAYQATGDITAADVTCFMPLLKDQITL